MNKGIRKYTLKIFLYEITPQIWRRLSVSGDTTFAELHEILQLAMGWEDKEQHEFRYGKGKNLTNVIAADSEEVVGGGDFTDEKDITVDQFMGRRRTPLRMLYRYDFLEDWVHELVIEKKEELAEGEEVLAELLEGERACPPEDCGGAWGYMSALEGEVDWMDDEFEPELFDPTAIDLSL